MRCKSRRMRSGHAAPSPRIVPSVPDRPSGCITPMATGNGSRHAWGTRRRAPIGRCVKGHGNDCAQARFRLGVHGLQSGISCAQTGFTPKLLILLMSRMVIISPFFRNPTKSGAWNAPHTPSSTRLSTGRVDSLARMNAVASGHGPNPSPVKPALKRLCTAACAAAFRHGNRTPLESILLFHTQAFDFKRH